MSRTHRFRVGPGTVQLKVVVVDTNQAKYQQEWMEHFRHDTVLQVLDIF